MTDTQHTAARTTAAVAVSPAVVGRAGPPIAVALPVYNGERYLERSLTSLLAQEQVDFELVIADNCSSDATEEICREFARQDNRIRYSRRDRNVGVVENHNRLIHESHGEFFGFAASDDEYQPDRLTRLEAALRACPDAVLAFSDSLIVDPEGDVVGEWSNDCRTDDSSPSVRLYDLFARPHPFLQFYGLIRRSALMRTRLLPPLKCCDQMLLGELVLHGPFAAVPEQLLHWRRHPEKTSEVLDARAFYAPNRRFMLPNVDQVRWLVGGVSRAPVAPLTRVRCYAALRPEVRRNAGAMLRNVARCGIDLAASSTRRRAR